MHIYTDVGASLNRYTLHLHFNNTCNVILNLTLMSGSGGL